MFGVTRHGRFGVAPQVTYHERTLVGVLERPELAGDWKEIWRSLKSVEFFDLDQVVAYTRLLENATAAAKAVSPLEQQREPLMAEEARFDALGELCPHQPHSLYTQPTRRPPPGHDLEPHDPDPNPKTILRSNAIGIDNLNESGRRPAPPSFVPSSRNALTVRPVPFLQGRKCIRRA